MRANNNIYHIGPTIFFLHSLYLLSMNYIKQGKPVHATRFLNSILADRWWHLILFVR